MRYVDLEGLSPAEAVAAVEGLIARAQSESMTQYRTELIERRLDREIIDRELAAYADQLLIWRLQAMARMRASRTRSRDVALTGKGSPRVSDNASGVVGAINKVYWCRLFCSGAQPVTNCKPPQSNISATLFLAGASVVFLSERVEMQATARCAIVGLFALVLGSCTSQTTPRDHAHALSEMADGAADDSAKCQSSGAALGSQAYKECRALLEAKISIEKDVPPDRGYVRTHQ
jgi:hypothetical protein